jgi:hypothetical protein
MSAGKGNMLPIELCKCVCVAIFETVIRFFLVDDTDFSESEGLSSAQINKRMEDHMRSPTSITSETEEESRDGQWSC